MKIATVTDDGKTISHHFGRARYYSVVTIEDGQVIEHEQRNKPGHHQFAQENHHHDHQHQHDARGHGFSTGSHGKHEQMAEVISDCEAVLARGMGSGAYQGMLSLGIKPIITDIATIDEAALAYAKGSIVDHTEKLH